MFRDKLQQIPSLSPGKELEAIFSNINEIYDFSVNLLGSLEDTMEVTQENESPAIGICFEELAEVSVWLLLCFCGENFMQWVASCNG